MILYYRYNDKMINIGYKNRLILIDLNEFVIMQPKGYICLHFGLLKIIT